MFLHYGAHVHADNEVYFSHSKKEVRSAIGRRQHFLHTFVINGHLLAADASALTTKMATLETAYDTNGNDLVFKENDNTTLTHHNFLNSTTINGVRVIAFDWLPKPPGLQVNGSGPTYVNRIDYRIVVEGEVIDSENATVEWYEEVLTIGHGGSDFVLVESLVGPVQRQETRQYTKYKVYQQGYATGHTAYLTAPAQLWPGSERGRFKHSSQSTPKYNVRTNTRFKIRWRYVYESATALTGGPNDF